MVRRNQTFAPLLVVTSLLLGWSLPAAAESVDYLRQIKPILKSRCYACHGALKHESELRLDTGASIRTGADGSAVIVPDDPDASELLLRVTAEDESMRMPPEGEPLAADQIALLRQWIAEGATSPSDERPETDPDAHWAFQAPVRPPVPTVDDQAVRNPIDAFIDARLTEQGLTVAPPASKDVLLRRVTLDLIGLPPTREELRAFVADDSPDAYDVVVDRLLQDPRYGERWARHWMDVWRYADWHGRRHVPDVWNSAPQVWRWRDWIVRSLNDDLGYDDMVRQMLAADEICPDDYNATVATAYIIRNWYALNPNDWMRNTVEHTGKAFLGLTFNCAHCHDHKYDPIAQDDYFRLRAFFEPIGIRQDRVPGEADPGPFKEYEYGVLRKIERLGSVQLFDKNPDAPTWFYTGGDERNRVEDRGTMTPGVPALFDDFLPAIETVELPLENWYPGLRPEIEETMRSDLRAAVAKAEQEVNAARDAQAEPAPELVAQLTQAEAAVAAAVEQAQTSGQSGALAGEQSLVLDATNGRRIINNPLSGLRSLEDGTTIQFQLLLQSPEHFNFQLAKDVQQGLTAAYIGFEQGRITSYQPGSFTEFQVGEYHFDAGQRRFRVRLELETEANQGLLTVQSLSDDVTVVEAVPVAINGWNPVGDPAKAITFDARPGSLAVVDDVCILAALSAGDGAGGYPLVAFDFESPTYVEDQDVVGVDGWTVSPLSSAGGTSLVSTTCGDDVVREAKAQLAVARRAVRTPALPRLAAEARLAAALAEQESLEARIAAEQLRYQSAGDVDATPLMRQASLKERQAALLKAEADLLAKEQALASAEAKPTDDADRAKEIATASEQLTAAQAAVTTAKGALDDESKAEEYAPLSPQYPRTSTGRRRALALWITDRSNPLTARVAVNHIWMRHFHKPLVDTVDNFGRSGADPTHPELLDWLAVELMESGWSMKHLHRLIVTSDAYQRSSSLPTDLLSQGINESDKDNRLLWRMNTGRMEAEVIRDSLLALGGTLDLTMGGQELENEQSLTTTRRSLYYATHPEQGGKSPLGELFDGPEARACYRRTRSIVPQQALALTNSELVHDVSGRLAKRVWNDVNADTDTDPDDPAAKNDAFLHAVFEEVLNRPPSEGELEMCRRFVETASTPTTSTPTASATTSGATAEGGPPMPQTPSPGSVRASLVRVLLSHNEFVTIR